MAKETIKVNEFIFPADLDENFESIKNMFDELYSYTFTEALTEGRYIGNVADGNYTAIGADGTFTLHGDATVWEDLREVLTGKNLNSVPGTADYDFDNLWVALADSGDIDVIGDVVGSNYQLPHSVKVGSTARLHLHWVQMTETSRTITGKYRIQKNGMAPATDWADFTATCTAAEDNVFPWVEGGLTQITRLVDIDLTDIPISSIIQVKIARTDTNAADTMFALYMDMHVEKDSMGSNDEFVK